MARREALAADPRLGPTIGSVIVDYGEVAKPWGRRSGVLAGALRSEGCSGVHDGDYTCPHTVTDGGSRRLEGGDGGIAEP
jgi:hypothetical protein